MRQIKLIKQSGSIETLRVPTSGRGAPIKDKEKDWSVKKNYPKELNKDVSGIDFEPKKWEIPKWREAVVEWN